MQIKLLEIVNFILKNRGNYNAFKDWDTKQICNEVIDSLQNGGLVVDVEDGSNKILGIIVAMPAPEYNVLHIKGILCLKNRGSLRRFIYEFRRRFEGWNLQAYRSDNLTLYSDTPRLINLLSRISK